MIGSAILPHVGLSVNVRTSTVLQTGCVSSVFGSLFRETKFLLFKLSRFARCYSTTFEHFPSGFLTLLHCRDPLKGVIFADIAVIGQQVTLPLVNLVKFLL
jgi:hypothetical protein